jgi:N-acetylneuraminate synthase
MSKVKVIAEAGVNHNGDPDKAFKLVEVALNAGADVIKFQTFKAKNVVTRSAPKAEYQKKTTSSQQTHYQMLKDLELKEEVYLDLFSFCKKEGIEFMSTAFDLESLSFLTSSLDLKTLKIASGDITNGPLILAHSLTGSNLILSTGMSTFEDIRLALEVVSFGLKKKDDPNIMPCKESFELAFKDKKVKEELKKKVTLLHCTTEYPAPLQHINLKAMQSMQERFDLDVGYSDHSDGILVSIAAVALGAKVIEKHITLDKSLEGPDHSASLEPCEFSELVSYIRDIESLMGIEEKRVTEAERNNQLIARRSLVAKRKIKTGELFTKKNIAFKRPGDGISPMKFWAILGNKSKRTYDPEDQINE